MSFFFCRGKTLSAHFAVVTESDNHHIHVIVMSVAGIGRQVKILADYIS